MSTKKQFLCETFYTIVINYTPLLFFVNLLLNEKGKIMISNLFKAGILIQNINHKACGFSRN